MQITYKDTKPHWIKEISSHIKKEFPTDTSQFGETSALAFIFKHIKPTNKIAVEFGARDGIMGSNTYHFEKVEGWKRVLFDSKPTNEAVIKAFITATNINDLLVEHNVPGSFDLLTVDIDGNDYYVWGSIRLRPKVVMVEYNPRFSGKELKVMVYNPNHVFDRTDYFGASLAALARLGRFRGYTMVSYGGLNAFFIRKDLVPDAPVILLDKMPARRSGWPADQKNREYVDVG